jgi:hypothetical protein
MIRIIIIIIAATTGAETSNLTPLNTPLFPGDQVTSTGSEDDLQSSTVGLIIN